jgi:hypothetical protein
MRRSLRQIELRRLNTSFSSPILHLYFLSSQHVAKKSPRIRLVRVVDSRRGDLSPMSIRPVLNAARAADRCTVAQNPKRLQTQQLTTNWFRSSLFARRTQPANSAGARHSRTLPRFFRAPPTSPDILAGKKRLNCKLVSFLIFHISPRNVGFGGRYQATILPPVIS